MHAECRLIVIDFIEKKTLGSNGVLSYIELLASRFLAARILCLKSNRLLEKLFFPFLISNSTATTNMKFSFEFPNGERTMPRNSPTELNYID